MLASFGGVTWMELTYFVYLKIVEWSLIMCCGRECTTWEVDVMGGAKNEYTLPELKARTIGNA